MKNREWLRDMALYDLMRTILLNSHKACPIEIVGERKPKCVPSIYGLAQTDCEKCIQKWLNEEVTTDRNKLSYNAEFTERR